MSPGTGRTAALYISLVAVVVILALASLGAGRAPIPWLDIAPALWSREDSLAALIVQELRLPRTLLAVLVGATLGLAGAALQGLLRNPLAEPGVIGISSCAALGAVAVFYSGLSQAFPLALPLGGVTGALAAVSLLYMLAGRGESLLALVLAGVALNSLAGALTALALNLSPNPFAAYEVFFWLLGSLGDRSMEHVRLALPLMLPGWLLLLSTGRALDALTLGEDAAASLGFGIASVRNRVVLGSALSVGAAVAVSGVVGFVGLVVPHLLRPLVAHRPGALLPASALGGAVLVLAADLVVRLLEGGQELKLGVVTALVGAPFFLYLVLHYRRRML
ncbi:MAG: iron ABC transporter permease [Gammaproteobacteria bacterium]|nr:iron ABC transporter permease [Gammaproteobacteria bacterium]